MNETHINQKTRSAIEAGEGILRLAPNWVPRSFCKPGRRLRLHPADYYALGTHRGGIDERWFASCTEAMNENRAADEGLSYIVNGEERFILKDAIAAEGPRLIGKKLWDEFHRWPVYSKFFDNLEPLPHHLHQNDAQAKLVNQQGKPEAYYFSPQYNPVGNLFPHTYFGLEPGTTKAQIRKCLERWNEGDNGILNYSKAYRLQPGTGWHVPTCILHAPGSLCTYEPQWGSDVLGMFQSMVFENPISWDLLVKDVPKEKQHDLDFIVDLIDWEANTDPYFKDHHYLEPIPVANGASDGHADKWVVYGKFNNRQLFTAKELTVKPGVKCTLKEGGAYGLLVTEGVGRIGKHNVHAPSMIRFGEMTEDELFITHEAAVQGVTFENTSPKESLVALRYFGPDANPGAPEVGDYKKLN
jgi:hypothetical protein